MARLSDPPTIRVARHADLRRIGELGALMVETHHRFDPERFLAASDGTAEGYAAFLGDRLEDPEAVVVVAEVVGEVAGYAFGVIEGLDFMSLRGPAAILHDVIVSPDYRCRGIGRQLVEAVLETLQSRGAKQAVLSTAEPNLPAQRLFATMGFRRTMIEWTRELGARLPHK
jgi:ribosomal protein S18 acetylase RimI-like enzyme